MTFVIPPTVEMSRGDMLALALHVAAEAQARKECAAEFVAAEAAFDDLCDYGVADPAARTVALPREILVWCCTLLECGTISPQRDIILAAEALALAARLRARCTDAHTVILRTDA